MTKTIAVVSGKGGVGKTTVAVNLAAAMHQLGENVLLVDANIRNPHVGFHFSDGLYMNTLHDYLHNRIDAPRAINFHPNGMKFVPGDPKGASKEFWSADLGLFANNADVVIFDAPPGDATDVLDHADQVLVVTQAQVPSLIDAFRFVQNAQKQGKIVAGVVLNKLDDHGLSTDQVESFLGHAVASVIPAEPKIPQSLFEKEAFVNLHPRTLAAKEFAQLASRICGRPR